MSPAAFTLLSMAFEHYERTSDKAFSYQFKNADDMIRSITGADQLYEDGYIDNVSDNVISSHVSIVPVTPSPLILLTPESNTCVPIGKLKVNTCTCHSLSKKHSERYGAKSMPFRVLNFSNSKSQNSSFCFFSGNSGSIELANSTKSIIAPCPFLS